MVVPHLRSATPQSSTSAMLALYYDIYCNCKRDLVSIVSMFFFELPAILLIRAVIAIVVVVIVIIIAIMIIIQTIRSLLLFRCCGCCSCCFIKYKEKTAPRGMDDEKGKRNSSNWNYYYIILYSSASM